jgi:PAS domain S-box-containing protein
MKRANREEGRVLAVRGESGTKGYRHAWLVYLLGGIFAIIGYYSLPSPSAQYILHGLSDLSEVGAILVGVLLYRPSSTLPWYLIAIGVAAGFAGDVFRANYLMQVEYLYPSAAFLSLSEPLYLVAGLFAVSGLLLIGRGGIGRRGGNLIDSLIIAVSLGLLALAFFVNPNAPSLTSSFLMYLLSITWPLVYVLIITILVRPLLVAEKRSPALYLLCGGAFLFVVNDLVFGSQPMGYETYYYANYEAGSSVYGGILLANSLIGAGALHPSMARLSEPLPAAPGVKLTRWRLVLITAATLAAPAVVAIQAILGHSIDVPLVVAGSTLLFLLVAARLAGLMAENNRIEDALRESEERYREMVELTPEIIAVHTAAPDPKWVYMNAAGAKLFGASKPEDLIGRPVKNFIHPDYFKFIEKRWRWTQVERKPTKPTEIKMVRLDGQVIDVETRGIPTIYKGRPATQVFILDITERKRAEEEMKEANQRLEELAVLKADFTRMVAHELDGPLGALRRLTEMLSAAGADPEVRTYATTVIEGEIAALDTLVADMRYAGEAEHDDFRVKLRPVNNKE